MSLQRLILSGFLASFWPLFSLAADPAPLSVLMLGDDGHHRPADMAKIITPVLAKQGIAVTYSNDVKSVNPAELAKYDCVAIYRDSGDLPPDAEAALLEFVEQGKGLVAIHCASHAFRNSAKYTALVGGRFLSHETGVFRARIVDAQHPAMRGVRSFESFDETYVHNELTKDRRVLMCREHQGGYEPWTWVRQQGQGRVYYTASGHDEKSWTNPGFQKLIEVGIRWASGQVNDDTPKLEYAEAGAGVPNYTPGEKWGAEGEHITKLQKPLSPTDSMQHMHTPEGFHVELFAAEPDIVKPIALAFDERGRLWVAESVDYPNTVLKDPERNGHDRIKICEDTDGDGRADKFTIFADNLNIPTGLAFARGGVIVALSPHLLFLKDTDGDDKADVREVLYTGFGRGDTHAVHSNLHYGLDNWMYGSVGYGGGLVKAGGSETKFAQGYFRFKSDGSAFEFLTSTSNNTWGLGLSEAGDVFGSTANGQHSVYLALPNRYFEGVRGWHGIGSAGIEDHKLFHPVTSDVRQVDFFGGFTAASGHELYTARSYPEQYWDRTALVCEPTGHLIHTNLLVPNGSSFTARDGYNLLASSDAWTAPIAAQVGPDGAVWVADWYNIIVQHNPTPQGFQTGAGAAYVTPLRDKEHGRIYRIVADGAKKAPLPQLSADKPASLVAALSNDNLLWRSHAQRLLVERGQADVLPQLAELVKPAASGPTVLHALRTMEGLKAFAPDDKKWQGALQAGLAHSWPGARRAALGALPRTQESTASAAKLLADPDIQVRRAALLALAEMPASKEAAGAIVTAMADPANAADRWVPSAAIAAAARSDLFFMQAASTAKLEPAARDALAPIARVVAEHYARSAPADSVGALLGTLAAADPAIAEPVLAGILAGWPDKKPPAINDEIMSGLATLVSKLPGTARLEVLSLARHWGAGDKFQELTAGLKTNLLAQIADAAAADEARLSAARNVMSLGADEKVIGDLLDAITPKVSPELATGLLDAVGSSGSAEVGTAIVERWPKLSPTARHGALALLARRPEWTKALLDGLENDKIAATDLSLDQEQQLARHPDAAIAERATKLLSKGGRLPNADRQKVLDTLLPLAAERGDAAQGKAVFEKNCAKCHRHGEIGASIGPDLTGVAARKREEILTDVLDPNRSVEGNFRVYTLTTEDGRIISGLLVAETKTAVELMDAEAKKHVVLREDIDQLTASKLSLMPEGFEKLPPEELVNLLEFLTTRGKYFPLPLTKVATVSSAKGMFYSEEGEVERLIFSDWGPKQFEGIPFHLVDPQGGRVPNVVMLHGPEGAIPPRMPKSVVIPCNGPAKAIHLLSGVSGWGYPASRAKSVSMIVKLHYAGGQTEEIPLINGEHFADYIRRIDVPGSKLAFMLRDQQIRYLAVYPKRTESIDTIELVKGPDATAPVVMAITVEGPQ